MQSSSCSLLVCVRLKNCFSAQHLPLWTSFPGLPTCCHVTISVSQVPSTVPGSWYVLSKYLLNMRLHPRRKNWVGFPSMVPPVSCCLPLCYSQVQIPESMNGRTATRERDWERQAKRGQTSHSILPSLPGPSSCTAPAVWKGVSAVPAGAKSDGQSFLCEETLMASETCPSTLTC